MILWLRPIRAEVRKGLTPMTLGVMALSAMLAAVMQYTSDTRDLGPSLVDGSGSATIALLQHAYLLGFVIAGVIAGQMTGVEVSESSILVTMIAEPRRWVLTLTKTVASVVLMWVSVVLMWVTLQATAILIRNGAGFSNTAGTPWSDTGIAAAKFTLIAVFLSAASALIATWSGSAIAPAMVTSSLFIVGLFFHGLSSVAANPTVAVGELTPYEWVNRLMQPEPFGRYVDYLGTGATDQHITRSAFLLAIFTGVAVIVTAAQLLDRAISHPKGSQ